MKNLVTSVTFFLLYVNMTENYHGNNHEKFLPKFTGRP